MSLKIIYCGACKSWSILCPSCGNNSCNGGSGKDCEVCSDVYRLQNQLNLNKETDRLLDKLTQIESTK